MILMEDDLKGSFAYGTIEEAERKLKIINKKRSTTYCIIQKGLCRENCGCYEPPVVVKIDTQNNDFWDCLGGFCTCYMLVGPTSAVP